MHENSEINQHDGCTTIDSASPFTDGGPPPERAVPVLLEVLDALTLEPDFGAFFAKAANAIASLLDADGAALMVLEESGHALHYRVFEGSKSPTLRPFVGMRFPATTGAAGRALRENRSLFIADYPSSPHAMPAFVAAGLKSSAVIPLITANQAVGVVAASWFGRCQNTPPEAGLMRLVERIAAQVALACHRDLLEARLHRLAATDALTGVDGRRGIAAALEERLELYRRSGRSFSVFLIDLDDFKAANDLCGHALGDDLLRDAAGRLRDVVRRGDRVGRLGGDEFLIIAHCGDDEIAHLAARLLQAVRITFGQGRITGSIGIATCAADATDAATLLHQADLAMYRCKTAGGDAYRRYESDMESHTDAAVATRGPGAALAREHTSP